MIDLRHCRATNQIFRNGRVFDSWALGWLACSQVPAELDPISPSQALKVLRDHSRVRDVPVAVIGPKEGTQHQLQIAFEVGKRIHEIGLALLCGGMSGVMESVCKGNSEAGGRPMAFLPGEDWRESNPYVAVPLATGIRQARNQLIARAAFAMVAVGGGYGTLSEIAFGLHFEKLVLSLADAPKVDGVIVCATVEEVIERLVERFFDLTADQSNV